MQFTVRYELENGCEKELTTIDVGSYSEAFERKMVGGNYCIGFYPEGKKRRHWIPYCHGKEYSHNVVRIVIFEAYTGKTIKIIECER